jgi:hypothetical protein
VTFYSPWNNCARCDRESCRWGIFAPAAREAKVLILTAMASRASQAVGTPDPLPALVAQVVIDMFHVKPSEVHVDVLLACGAASELQAHEAAACFQRVHDQAIVNNWGTVLVVLVGQNAERLARYAGLLTASGFLLGEALRAAVVVRDPSEVGVAPAWRVLRPRRLPAFSPTAFPSALGVLQELVHRHCRGHAWRPLGGTWRRSFSPPTAKLVEDHVAGRGWLSPFLPTGNWRYCVLDVDLHNAIQYAAYDDTVAKLRKLFPTSLYFRSSPTGGLHIYVLLPDGVQYADAAVTLAEFLLMNDLLFKKVGRGANATVVGAVATRLVEVPLHPPRLPFGLGSVLEGEPDPLLAVQRFELWLLAGSTSDFDAVRTAVMTRQGGARRRWPGRSRWANLYMHDLELKALGLPAKRELVPSDPWAGHIGRLSPTLAALATNGSLAFGLRTATMMRLADALPDLTNPAGGRALLRAWVELRDHHSEDIHIAKHEVLEYADRLVDEVFADRGIPNVVWAAADEKIHGRYASPFPPAGLTLGECRRAAFCILELFYRRRCGALPIAAERFGLALENNNIGRLPVRRPQKSRVGLVRQALTSLGILCQTRAPNRARHRAGEYQLMGPYWPPPPSGTPYTYQP